MQAKINLRFAETGMLFKKISVVLSDILHSRIARRFHPLFAAAYSLKRTVQSARRRGFSATS